jgi:hypothetical protein
MSSLARRSRTNHPRLCLICHEAGFYQIFGSAQGSTIPVFLGSIHMAQSYFRQKAGEIQHMLLIALEAESLTQSQ